MMNLFISLERDGTLVSWRQIVDIIIANVINFLSSESKLTQYFWLKWLLLIPPSYRSSPDCTTSASETMATSERKEVLEFPVYILTNAAGYVISSKIFCHKLTPMYSSTAA
jgi:hypothetical protein